ncbi:MAG: hypothetical protein JXR37_20610 [Kiritimatiellae bacterium]|nr:hypothetical protein [Kiritimatiellia bacterium]
MQTLGNMLRRHAPAAAAGLAAALLMGCGGQKRTPEKPAPAAKQTPPAKSTAQDIIEGFTGKTAVESGRKATGVIHRVQTERDENLKDFFGEDGP